MGLEFGNTCSNANWRAVKGPWANRFHFHYQVVPNFELSLRYFLPFLIDRYVLNLSIPIFKVVSLSHESVAITLGLALHQQHMDLPYFLSIQVCLILHEGVDHGLQSALLHILWHVISVVAMGVGLFPHGVGEEKGHVKFHRA